MIYVVGSGGGGGLPADKPVIHVIAPDGCSQVTVSKTGTSIDIPTTNKHTNWSDANLEDWFCSIPKSSSSTTWTVTAKKTGESDMTETVTVAANSTKWYDVEVSGKFYIVRNGLLKVGSWDYAGFPGSASMSGGMNCVKLKQVANGYGLESNGKFAVTPAINLSSYSSFKCDWEQSSNGGKMMLAAGYDNSGIPTTIIEQGTKTLPVETVWSRVTTTLDVSSMSGNYFIGFIVNADDASTDNTASVYNAWLE